jgi:excisionase family DNA binding protein
MKSKPTLPITWENAPDILTAREASTLVRISRNGLYGAIQAGLLPAVRLGPRRIRIAKAALKKVFGVPQEDSAATAALSHGKA